ncbi:BZ3500_MvSof-1268-A1-R1_Chr5-3g08292 [Microbotryum saponariae]|uniref:BZ3500_MvSof-1268-A1-R1_Chr5-3g08292 protein n=1 Tax=Microbotryum saponariae TaxID=289078 RepID=A0A2X0LS04_9BASI|nr:BZ3500_MvSof-1268-A1-R1_Chr5-3g08292 [Microbotryum saponariae]SDA08400.1 BZ3501_MvSof-1269-A2-R1_Chr5-3g08020 [Microbotryum saponariae]
MAPISRHPQPPTLSQSDSDDSDASSDDEAPEEVSLSTAKSIRLEQQRQEGERGRSAKEQQRKKNQERDRKLKAAKLSRLKQEQVEKEDEFASEEKDVPEHEQEEPLSPQASTSSSSVPQAKHSYLDPSLFAQAGELYKPAPQVGPGEGKRGAKLRAKEEKRLARERKEEREREVKEGGSRQVGEVTIQHLVTTSRTPASLATTALPSHTSAAKFLTSRLYSTKRKVAVLDQGKPRPIPEDSRKRRKDGKKGMSKESKMLLGLGMDDGAKEVSEHEMRRNKKRQLLLQAEGTRKAPTLARPLASGRNKPAAHFAVAKRDK